MAAATLAPACTTTSVGAGANPGPSAASHATGPRQQLTMARHPNGHLYQRIDQNGVTFDEARVAAAAMTFGARTGHLAVFETDTYRDELAFVHEHVYAPGVLPQRVYWVGASRPNSAKASTADWTWVDGTAVPPSVTQTWSIDFREGKVAEGCGFFWGAQNSQLGDYSADNSTGLVGGFIVEFEPFDA